MIQKRNFELKNFQQWFVRKFQERLIHPSRGWYGYFLFVLLEWTAFLLWKGVFHHNPLFKASFPGILLSGQLLGALYLFSLHRSIRTPLGKWQIPASLFRIAVIGFLALWISYDSLLGTRIQKIGIVMLGFLSYKGFLLAEVLPSLLLSRDSLPHSAPEQ